MSDLLDDIVPPNLPKLDLDALDRIIERLEVDRFTREPLHAAIAELRRLRHTRPSRNGQAEAHEATCYGCGKPFARGRRVPAGRRAWCDECRAIGEPEAQRARDYRERKQGGVE